MLNFSSESSQMAWRSIYLHFSLQVEVAKKREAEIQKMRRDFEEQAMQHDQAVSALKKKQQDAVNELSDQLDSLQKAKSKSDLVVQFDTYNLKSQGQISLSRFSRFSWIVYGQEQVRP